MLDAIQASTPDWNGKIGRIHYSLGSAFDKFMDPKYLLEPWPKEMQEEYDLLFVQAQAAILENLIKAHVQAHGPNPTAEYIDFKDSNRKK